MRTLSTKTCAISYYNGLGDQLYDIAGERPTLDLNFASNKSLVDSVTGKTLVTHTRASNATYVDGDGIIKDAVTNLLLRSEDFSTTWSTSDTSVSTNQTTAPDGTTTADKLICGTGTPIFQGITQTFTATTAATRFSVYVKAGELNQVELRTFNPTEYAIFNLSDGTVAVSGGDPDASTIDAGNGWYRCSISAPDTGVTSARISLADGDSRTFTPVTDAGIYLWGAQLEQSSTVGEYVKTTSTINSAPRFDHNPTTGESLGLLVEESRTNLVPYSEEFDNGWSTQRTVVSANQITAPNGTATADKITGDGTGGGAMSVLRTVSATASTSYRISVYAKAGTAGWLAIEGYDGVDNREAYFDLVNGVPGGISGPGMTDLAIQPVGDGWYRCSVTRTTNAGSTSIRPQFTLATANFTISVADTKDFYLWGAQLEAGSFPTSYIRTNGSTVTRSADVTSITGTNFSSWYNQTEGTVFSDNLLNSGNTGSYAAGIVSINDGTNQNEILQFYSSATQVNGYMKTAGTTVANVAGGSFVSGSDVRTASAFGFNNVNSATNGLIGTTDTNATLPTVTTLKIGQQVSVALLNGTISRLTYWPTRLSNDTLQTITV